MPTPATAFILFAGAFLPTLLGVQAFRRWTNGRRKLLDMPNDRSSHTHPTPRGGGLVIAAVSLIGGSAWVLSSGSQSSWNFYGHYLGGALLIAAVSWLDDLHSLSASTRFSVHILAAVWAVSGVGYWRILEIPLLGTVAVGWWGVPLTLLWIAGLTNAYNFMDGTDGIAAGQALVAGLGWALLGLDAGFGLISAIGLILAGSSLGFLFHNWHPARVFMGDVGSSFLGYTLAVLPLLYSSSGSAENGARSAFMGLLLVWPFVFDTAFTFFRRLLRRENVLAAHRSHLYQRMTTTVSGHPQVAVLYSGLTLLGVVWARGWAEGDYPVSMLIPLPALCLGLWGLPRIARKKADNTEQINI